MNLIKRAFEILKIKDIFLIGIFHIFVISIVIIFAISLAYYSIKGQLSKWV